MVREQFSLFFLGPILSVENLLSAQDSILKFLVCDLPTKREEVCVFLLGAKKNLKDRTIEICKSSAGVHKADLLYKKLLFSHKY